LSSPLSIKASIDWRRGSERPDALVDTMLLPRQLSV
jgi:hypothetical protein